MKTNIYKNHYGWKASTSLILDNQEYEIVTMKKYSGLSTVAHRVKHISENMIEMGTVVYSVKHEGKATEKKIRELHQEHLKLFLKTIITEDQFICPMCGEIFEKYQCANECKEGSEYFCQECWDIPE